MACSRPGSFSRHNSLVLDEVQAAVAARPANSSFILLLDFDGTLAEFNPNPAAPQLTPERRDWLERISRQPGMVVGIVSGRRLDDLQERTRLPGHVYHAGLHGLEIEIESRRTGHPDLLAAAQRLDGLAEALRRLAIEHPGAELAEFFGMPGQARSWKAWADTERERILARAYNAELGVFTQALDGHYPDASNLLLPQIGLIDPTDPRFRSTVRAYEKLLAPDGLMLRYRHLDDFGHTTSAFSICSFWWVEALAMMGEVDEAVALFRKLEQYANPLGLFSEDIEPSTGELLGNFPQAYTHVGLIHAAITIGEIFDARSGLFRAWT